MQCLYTASEDNPEAQEKIRGRTAEFETMMGAQDANSPHELYLQILSVGVVINAADSAAEELSEATWRLVVSTIAKLMDVDQRKMVRMLSFGSRARTSCINPNFTGLRIYQRVSNFQWQRRRDSNG